MNPVLNPADEACTPAEIQTQSSKTTLTPVNNLETLYPNLLSPPASNLIREYLRRRLVFCLSAVDGSVPSRGGGVRNRSKWNMNA